MLVLGGVLFISWGVWDGFFAKYPIMPRRVLNRTFVCLLYFSFDYTINNLVRMRLYRLFLLLFELPGRHVLFVLDLGGDRLERKSTSRQVSTSTNDVDPGPYLLHEHCNGSHVQSCHRRRSHSEDHSPIQGPSDDWVLHSNPVSRSIQSSLTIQWCIAGLPINHPPDRCRPSLLSGVHWYRRSHHRHCILRRRSGLGTPSGYGHRRRCTQSLEFYWQLHFYRYFGYCMESRGPRKSRKVRWTHLQRDREGGTLR